MVLHVGILPILIIFFHNPLTLPLHAFVKINSGIWDYIWASFMNGAAQSSFGICTKLVFLFWATRQTFAIFAKLLWRIFHLKSIRNGLSFQVDVLQMSCYFTFLWYVTVLLLSTAALRILRGKIMAKHLWKKKETRRETLKRL